MTKSIQMRKLAGSIRIPASKSHTIRAIQIASLAKGRSILQNPLFSSDTQACIRAWRAFGAEIEEEEDRLLIKGLAGQLKPPEDVIDVANSGTTLYLGLAAAGLGELYTVFTGDEQIRRRSAARLLGALVKLGVHAVSTRENGCAPIIIKGPLKGGRTEIDCPTSQYLSALLLACPLAEGHSEIRVPLLNERPYVDMSLAWLDSQGIAYQREGYEFFSVPGGQSYQAFQTGLPGDYSSASFFLCAAGITGSEITVEGLRPDDPQGDKAVLNILEIMGCTIDQSENAVRIRGAELRGGDFDLNSIPDALPALSALACYAVGETRLANVPQAREKETDRIAIMAGELRKMGADIEELPDGLVIQGKPAGTGTSGKKGPGKRTKDKGAAALKGGRVFSHGDHRVAMALAIAGLGAEGETIIEGADCVSVTVPSFFRLLDSLSRETA